MTRGRLTMRGAMVLVVLCALVAWAVELRRRAVVYRHLAARHRREVTIHHNLLALWARSRPRLLSDGVYTWEDRPRGRNGHGGDPSCDLAELHARLALKYERAATRAWRRVEPDTGPPLAWTPLFSPPSIPSPASTPAARAGNLVSQFEGSIEAELQGLPADEFDTYPSLKAPKPAGRPGTSSGTRPR